MSRDDDYRNRRQDDAYDELLAAFTDDLPPTPKPKQTRQTRAKPAQSTRPSGSVNKSNFKLDIKDLDSQFNNPPKPQVYKRSPQAKPPVKRYSSPKKNNDIELVPAFESTARTRKKADDNTVKPQYKKENAQQTRQGRAGTKQNTRRRTNQNVSDKPIKTKHGGVILRKNLAKGKFDIKAFANKHKRALVVLAVCVSIAIIISSYTISCINDILAMNRDSEKVITVNLPANTNTEGAIDILKDNKLIKHKYFCLAFTKLMNYRDDNYLTGIYYFTQSMGLENMLSTFKKPVTTGETVSLTFPEGYNVDQIAEKLEQYNVCSKTAFYQTMKEVDFSSEYSFIQQEDNKELRYHKLEGYLYPDTYEFFVGENASAVVRKFLNNFKEKWTDEYDQKAKSLGMSIDDVITTASIIEKEAYGDDQMPLVSSVLHNRLRNSGLFPSLQCDSTEAYINEYIAKNTQGPSELAKYTQNYSSYKVAGLPVGAICNPGKSAIEAALNPTSSSYYYFAHDNNKQIYMASTDAERRANNSAIARANSAKKSEES